MLARQAGTAVIWKGVQLLGRRIVSTLRLLILARILLPEDFGLFSIALVIVETVMSLTDVGMLPAIVQMERPDEKNYDAAWSVNVVKALLIVLIVLLLAPWLADLFQEPRAVNLIRLLAFRPLIDAFASTKTAELTRQFRFQRLTFIFLPAIIIETVVSVISAQTIGVWGLVVGALIGACACVVLSYILAPYRPRFRLEMDHVKPLIQFGRWIFITKVIAVAGSGVLQIIISRRLGAESLGLYYLAIKLAFLPNDFAAEVVGAVAFPLYARLQHDLDRIAAVFRTIVTGLTALLCPVYALLFLLAPAVVEHLLGDKWQGSAPIIQVLAVVGIIGLFGDAVVPVLQGMGRPYWVAVLELVQSTAIIVSVGYLADNFGAEGAAAAWIVAIGPSQFVSAYLLGQLLHRPFVGLGRSIVVVLAGTTAAVTVAVIVHPLLTGIPALIISCGTAAAVTLLLYWYLDRLLGIGMVTRLLKGFPQFAERLGLKIG